MIRLIILLILCVSCDNIHKKYKGYYKIGKQYTINDQTYFPQHYAQYNEMGIASWYSDDCYKCKTHDVCDKCVTANGEIFNKNLLTAAHRTLPMPSMVKVINLDNGKSAILKVNDRGPFRNNRIIDVSEKAAEVLDFKKQGLATVRIEYLQNATERLIKSKLQYKKTYRRVMKGIRNDNIFSSSIEKTPASINHNYKDDKTSNVLLPKAKSTISVEKYDHTIHNDVVLITELAKPSKIPNNIIPHKKIFHDKDNNTKIIALANKVKQKIYLPPKKTIS